MPVNIIKGNIFTSRCKTVVNTVNTVGVMGAGIALECRLRYPRMYEKYVELCKAGRFDIGTLWLFRSHDRWILNFPTKRNWKYPSKIEYLHAGLEKFVTTYEKKGIDSIAFPLLGADRGGIDQQISLEVMQSYLDKLPIDIEIYLYDRFAPDDLYETTKAWFKSKSTEELMQLTGMRRDYIEKVSLAMERTEIVQLNQLASVKGIGVKTLEKLFRTFSPDDSLSTGHGQQSFAF
jgi:O-acetyl-ADP-ribose deacetylase (regulator of RNase III)